MLSKMRNASRARNSTATMIAARMLGMMTFHSRCPQVAPSTLAASTMSSETCARPASSSSDMNGVVFQISEIMIANIAGQCEPNQLVLSLTHGSHENQLLTKPLLMLKANCQENAETTVMIP